MEQSRDELFEQVAAAIGYSFDGEIAIGGKYVSTIEHEDEIYVSGQIPRVGSTVVVTGRVGAETSLEQGKLAAKICAMRALALLQRSLGDLGRVKKILRITVYVQSAPDFTQQSEVADGASEVLHTVFSSSGVHTRTSVGVLQLPKNAAVELDMIAVVESATQDNGAQD
jgi:enamine deaminase RidA (YjgF/YER057c/UK114 family)